MKTFFAALILLLASGLFFAGWRFGYHQGQVGRGYAIPLIERHLADAASKALMLHLMDLGHYSDARAIVQGQFNWDILEADELGNPDAQGNEWDIRRQEIARRTCAMIIAFRSAYPSNYICRPDHGDAWMVKTVDTYLKQTSGESKK